MRRDSALRQDSASHLVSNLTTRTSTQFETRSCEFFIIIKSRYGCPTQCSCLPSDPTCNSPSSRVCSGHGICGYDATIAKAKCFCNERWADGNEPCSHFVGDASNTATGTPSASFLPPAAVPSSAAKSIGIYIGTGVTICCALAAAIAAAFYMRRRRLAQAETQYKELPMSIQVLRCEEN